MFHTSFSLFLNFIPMQCYFPLEPLQVSVQQMWVCSGGQQAALICWHDYLNWLPKGAEEIAGVRCCCELDQICSGNLRHEVMENEKCWSGEKRGD
jgi:hypothetical protein